MKNIKNKLTIAELVKYEQLEKLLSHATIKLETCESILECRLLWHAIENIKNTMFQIEHKHV